MNQFSDNNIKKAPPFPKQPGGAGKKKDVPSLKQPGEAGKKKGVPSLKQLGGDGKKKGVPFLKQLGEGGKKAVPGLLQLRDSGRKIGGAALDAAKIYAEGAVQDLQEALASAFLADERSILEHEPGGAGGKDYVLITGASSGIGAEFARRLSLEGYPLILVARRRDRLEALRSELGTECLLLPADLSRREDLIRLCEDLVGRRIEIFINNAGFGVSGPFMATDLMREVNMIDVNVTAQHVLLKYVLHRMEAEGGGSILNVASSAGLFPAGPNMAGYYATKAYMTSLTRGVAQELSGAGSSVYVGCLCPGPVNTEFNDVADVSFAMPGISVEECVGYALKMMAKKRTVIIPSARIRAAVFAQRLIPTALTVKLTAGQQKNRGQECDKQPEGVPLRMKETCS